MLDGFDFYPTHPMDIEKPASVSKDQLFLWRLPLNSAGKFGHIRAYEQLDDSTIRIEAAFDFHLRYQACADGGDYAEFDLDNGVTTYFESEPAKPLTQDTNKMQL